MSTSQLILCRKNREYTSKLTKVFYCRNPKIDASSFPGCHKVFYPVIIHNIQLFKGFYSGGAIDTKGVRLFVEPTCSV